MNKKIKLLASSLIIVFLLSFFVGLVSIIPTEVKAEKVYKTATIDEEFDGTSVIVTMTKEASEINRVYHQSFFHLETEARK